MYEKTRSNIQFGISKGFQVVFKFHILADKPVSMEKKWHPISSLLYIHCAGCPTKYDSSETTITELNLCLARQPVLYVLV